MGEPVMGRILSDKPLSGKGRLVALSFLMLFVELALIRWTGSNVVYLSFYSNFILLGSFLGIGLGFLMKRSRFDLFPWASLMLTAFVLFVLWFPVTIGRVSDDVLFLGEGTKGLSVWIVLPIVFLAVAAIMAAIAKGVADSFAEFEPLEAYRLDILGSIAGIATFSLLSFLWEPPLAWGLIASGLFFALYKRPFKLIQVAAAAVLLVALYKESVVPNFFWSPYYRITLFQYKSGLIDLDANNIPHQQIRAIAKLNRGIALYFVPYDAMTSKRPDRVLIVGAGNGIDVAMALLHDARWIDAVEIDPRIYQIGRELNPDQPYRDPRVHIHINDGRAFLQKDRNQYDLVLFALPDSLTLVSGQSSLRLESYLFTTEALQSARAHLKPGGVFAMYNVYFAPWIVDRLANELYGIFGQRPCIARRSQFAAVLTVGLTSTSVSCTELWNPGQQAVPAPTTDDWPFLYLKTRGIPPLYVITLGLIALCSLVLIRAIAGPFGQMRPYVDLFFMGAAFLLLETKSVVQFSLLFGSTWFVNALVFFGVLVAVYGAIETARRRPIGKPAVAYGALFAWLAVAWAIEPSRLLALDAPLRLAAAIVLSFGPIFLANVIFADRFRSSASSTIAFGTNLLGAMLGGILEYSSLVLGYRNLLVVVALLYALAFVSTPRETEPARIAEAT
jgi:hypothetical protein